MSENAADFLSPFQRLAIEIFILVPSKAGAEADRLTLKNADRLALGIRCVVWIDAFNAHFFAWELED